jgi:glutathione S-transferase
MLTLYYKPTCPYSQQVLGEAEELGVQFNLKDVTFDMDLRDELFLQGGKNQTPFLIDPQRGVKMYESDAIVAYIKEFYLDTDGKTFGGLRVHKSEDICDTCQ